MRIIGGRNKRKLLRVPSGLPVRPTTDMAKEALFNILNNHFDFEGLQVLDLFAGTGSITFEFASRGAREVIAVDINKRCVDHIRHTARLLEYQEVKALRADAFRFIGLCTTNFDIVFADPPYDMKGIADIPDLVLSHKLLTEEGWLVLEHQSNIQFGDHPAFFEKRKYGRVHFSLFKAGSSNGFPHPTNH